MITCACPANESIPLLGSFTVCPENFGQIQKVAFQRLKNDDGTTNSFPTNGTGDIKMLASWTPLLTKNGSERVSVSCYIQAPTEDGGDAITFGGGNDTLGGVELIVGRNPVNFSGVIRSMSQREIELMKRLQCEVQAGNIGVYLFDENGNIECVKRDTEQTAYPIPIRSLFVGDKIHGGYDTPDSNVISWSYMPNYSDDITIIKPNFNPLTDLSI